MKRVSFLPAVCIFMLLGFSDGLLAVSDTSTGAIRAELDDHKRVSGTGSNPNITSIAASPEGRCAFSRLGIPNALYIGELLGIVLILLWFLRATTPMRSQGGEGEAEGTAKQSRVAATA